MPQTFGVQVYFLCDANILRFELPGGYFMEDGTNKGLKTESFFLRFPFKNFDEWLGKSQMYRCLGTTGGGI